MVEVNLRDSSSYTSSMESQSGMKPHDMRVMRPASMSSYMLREDVVLPRSAATNRP